MEARGVGRRFGSVVALQDVNLAVRAGEVLGLVGDNGAGKSTLLKILAGSIHPSAGQILVDGRVCRFDTPKQSRAMGIEVVYQDLALATELSISDNIFLGREIRRSGWVGRLGALDRKRMSQDAVETLASLGIEFPDVRARCSVLSGGERQAVAVARAVRWGSKVLLLDEPTAALSVGETARIGALIRRLRDQGTPVVLVSHDIPQVYELCDRVVGLFRGRVVADEPKEHVSVAEMIMWITGVRSRK